jgi:hypothetical protein
MPYLGRLVEKEEEKKSYGYKGTVLLPIWIVIPT